MTCLKIFKNKPTLNVDVKPFKKYLGALLLFIDEILDKYLNKLLNIRDIIKVIWGLLFELHEGSIFIKHIWRYAWFIKYTFLNGVHSNSQLFIYQQNINFGAQSFFIFIFC